MAYTRMTDSVENISALSDRPNDNDGMSAAALKATFDAAGAAIKAYLNETLLGELDAEHDALTALQQAIEDIEAGSVTDGSITNEKLAALAVTAEKISELAVTNPKLAPLAVTAEKIAALAVTTPKIADRAVTDEKIALAAILNEHLGTKIVKQANMDDDSVGTAQLIDGGVTFAKTSGVQRAIHHFSGSLTVAGWSNKAQSLSISGMTASCEFVASPTAEGWAEAVDAMLFPPTAGAGVLTFTCDTVPTAAIPVTVYWWEA